MATSKISNINKLMNGAVLGDDHATKAQTKKDRRADKKAKAEEKLRKIAQFQKMVARMSKAKVQPKSHLEVAEDCNARMQRVFKTPSNHASHISRRLFTEKSSKTQFSIKPEQV